jgi:hypothetical protein
MERFYFACDFQVISEIFSQQLPSLVVLQKGSTNIDIKHIYIQYVIYTDICM